VSYLLRCRETLVWFFQWVTKKRGLERCGHNRQCFSTASLFWGLVFCWSCRSIFTLAKRA